MKTIPQEVYDCRNYLLAKGRVKDAVVLSRAIDAAEKGNKITSSDSALVAHLIKEHKIHLLLRWK